MSTIVYGALTRKREVQDANNPIDTSKYVDAVVALIPAEVLGLHALLMSAIVDQKTNTSKNVITLTFTQKHEMKTAFVILIALSILIYWLAHLKSVWDQWDFVRMLIPPTAFIAWCLLQRTSVWDAIKPGMNFGWRQFLGAAIAVGLGALSVVLAGKADDKSTAPQPAATGTTPAATPASQT